MREHNQLVLVLIAFLGCVTPSKRHTSIVRNSPPILRRGIANFHTATFGWSHTLAPSLRFAVSAGPGWSNPGTQSGPWRTTVQGSAQLSRETRRGGIAISFVRSDVFAGVIGNGFNNHYALRIDRKLGSRFNLIATGSYLQQQFFGAQSLAGEMGSVEAVWSTSRNWSLVRTGSLLGYSRQRSLYRSAKSSDRGCPLVLGA